MTAELVARTPLDGFADRFAVSPLVITEAMPARQLVLRVAPDLPAAGAVESLLGLTLPVSGRSVGDATQTAVWLGPDEWLLLDAAPEGDLADLVRPSGGAVVDVSAQRTMIEISGPYAREVLAKGCSLDLHPRVASAGLAVSTLLAHVPVIIEVRDPGPELHARIIIRTTFARHLAEWLLDAASEYVAAS